MSIRTEINEAFADIVASIGEQPRCEIVTHNGSRCARTAQWHTDLHGCSAGLTCAHHLNAWLRNYRAQLGHDYGVRCTWCSRVFVSVEDFIKAVSL